MTTFIDISLVSMAGKPANAITPTEYINRINNKLSILSNIKFNGFLDSWNGSHTMCEFECLYHGKWNCSINNFTKQTKDCPECLGCKNLTEEKIIENVQNILSSEKYMFHSISKFKGKDSILNIECPEHGIWNTCTYNNLKHGNRCPECGNKKLYMPIVSEDDLYLYIFISSDHFKYGVTNNIQRRLSEIKSSSGFLYELHSYFNIGKTNMLENNIKANGYHSFKSKSEYGDGYTETVDISLLTEFLFYIENNI